MKRWLAYLLLVIFSSQVLPVKAIGKLVAKKQMTEEVKANYDGDDTTDDSDDDNREQLKEMCITSHATTFRFDSLRAFKLSPARPGEEVLPHSHVADIHCPPPNWQ